jgi:hypothetical protein
VHGVTVPCPQCSQPVSIPARYPTFDPARPCELADDFRASKADFYTTASERMLGRKPKKGTSEREHLKQTILGMVNGMGAISLAKRLLTTKETAQGYFETFARGYSQVAAFTELMKHAFALTGTATTYAGRRRRSTAHWWLVNKSVVDVFISYKGADKLWLRVVPLQPGRRTLTCWVLSVIDAKYGSPNEGLEIYKHCVGRISQRPYRFFQDGTLIFKRPVRNIPWRIIRKVRTRTEEAVYEGFDRASRQLFNHICQGGTADISKVMMLRAEPVCTKFGARMILQIHDEIVFEVPKALAGRFTRSMKATLERPPCESFRVPIVVEPKAGERFGDLRKLHPQEVSPWWIVRIWYHLKQRWAAFKKGWRAPE